MEDISRYYTLLRDPTRRKIIEILGVQKKSGFKDLREALGLGVGTIYYHLDMLSDFLTQDEKRKYQLNDRGKMLYRILKEGSVPPTLEITEAFTHRLAKWIFLSPVFAKTVKPLRFLPASIATLVTGALGSAYAQLDPALFFYFPYSTHNFTTAIALYLFNWIGLFLFADFLMYLLYRRAGNDLQLFACTGIASFASAIFPFIYVVIPAFFPNLPLDTFNTLTQGILLLLQIWNLLLISAAFCYGKGIRLDKAFVVSLTAIYLNIAILFMLGRFT